MTGSEMGFLTRLLEAWNSDEDDECLTCGEVDGVENECPQSKRPCGHHCNCIWIHDCCHWCGGEIVDESMFKFPDGRTVRLDDRP